MTELFHSLVLTHTPDLPYCCYDTRREKVSLRVLASAAVTGIDLIYGDPYHYDRVDDNRWVWRWSEAVLFPRYKSEEVCLWHIEMDTPHWRRLRYGFRFKSDNTPGIAGPFYFSESGITQWREDLLYNAANFFLFPYFHAIDTPTPPEWAGETVWYQIFPDRFCKGESRSVSLGNTTPQIQLSDWNNDPPSPHSFFGGNIAGIIEKIPYLARLGITGLYLTPVFTSPSNHKYDTSDYYAVDTNFGTIEELRELVTTAHDAGMRVMFDAVFNHCGAEHPFWQDVLHNQESSPYKDYFHIHHFPVREDAWQSDERGYESFAFANKMPKWNTDNPAVRDYLIGAAVYWIRECGIDAWRLDVANEVSIDFWRAFSAAVRNEARIKGKEFYIAGELWFEGSRYLRLGVFDAVMHYPLGFSIASFFLRREVSAATFSNRLVQILSWYGDTHNAASFNLLDSHDTSRVFSMAKGDERAVRAAFTMLFLLPGSPCIYYGTEVALEGDGDPHCRAPMPWHTIPQYNDPQSIQRNAFHENVTAPDKRNRYELFLFFQKLIAFRKKNHAFIRHASLSYKPLGPLARWELSAHDKTRRWFILYTEKNETNLAGLSGERRRLPCVFSSLDWTGSILPPYCMVIFEDA